MSSEIGAMLDSYMSQFDSLLARMEQLRRPSRRQSTRETSKLIGGIAGAVSQNIFESRAAGTVARGLARQWVVDSDEQSLSAERRAIETDFRHLLGNVDSYLSTVSILTANLKPTGNSQRLRRRLATCLGAAKLNTRIRWAVQALYGIKSETLVRNSDIPAALEKMHADEQGIEPYETLRRLELGLRSFIAARLGALTPKWWETRIPEDVRALAEGRMKRNTRLWPWQDEQNELIQYVNFSEYVKIITKRDNWDEVFSRVFRDKEVISGKLKELDPIRNDIAHNRKLSSHRLRKLQVYSQDILKALGQA